MFPRPWLAVDLTGTRRDGSTIVAGIDPLAFEGFDPARDEPNFDVANPELDVSGLVLTDLQTLRIERGQPDVTYAEFVCDPLNLDRWQEVSGETPDIRLGLDQDMSREGRITVDRFSTEVFDCSHAASIGAIELAPFPLRAGPPLPAGGSASSPGSAAGQDGGRGRPVAPPFAHATDMRSATFSQLTSSSRKFCR